MSKEALEKAHAALKRMASYGDTFGYRSNEQNPYEKVCEAIAAIDALAQQPAQQEPVFYGFMREEECCVNICYTPHAPGGPNNELPTAYYTQPAQRKPLTHEQRVDLLAKFEAHKHEWHAPAILIDMVEAAHGIKENT